MDSTSPPRARVSVAIAVAFALSWASPRAADAEPRGEITVALTPLTQLFDPINFRTTTDYMVMSMVFDGLVNLGPEGMKPGLATDWKVSADGLTIDFNLRRGVAWHNGDPFTAEDVKFTYDGILAQGSTNGFRKAFVDAIRAVEVTGTHSVRLDMKQPWANFFHEVRGGAVQAIAPKRYYEKVGPKGFQEKPIGTGPFKLESLTAGEWTRFQANREYWGAVPKVERVTLRLAAEDFTRYAMLANGEADIITGISGPLLDRIKSDPRLRLVYARYNGTNSLHFMRTTNPEFRDRRVRLAVAHAIDRESMARTILGGLCEPSTHYFTPATFGHNPSLEPIPYDPERAKALLREAGVKPGHGLDFIIHSQAFASSPNGPAMQEAIAGYLEAAGFRFTRKPYETGAWLALMRSVKQSGVFYGTSVIPVDGGGLMASYYLNTSYSAGNQIDVPEYEKAYKDQLRETNPERRRKILQDWAALEAERLEAVPLFWCHYSFALGPKIGEMKPGLGSGYHLNLELVTLAP